jgi:hypothetical protein
MGKQEKKKITEKEFLERLYLEISYHDIFLLFLSRGTFKKKLHLQ